MQNTTTNKPALILPESAEFSIKDIQTVNPTVKVHNIYPAVRKLVVSEKITEAYRKSMGKGKPAVFYKKV